MLDNRQYKYLICDGCHFFTSDSTFNPNTDEMLKEIVTKAQNSIRVYLSATPEIACEAIISAEFNLIKNKKSDDLKNLEDLQNSSDYKIDKFKLIRQYPCYEMLESIEQVRTYKTIEFYYFKRNYYYLNIEGTYSDNAKLIEKIKSSESKWIVFVKSNSDGKDFEEKLSKSEISCCFISRHEIEESKKSTKDYFNGNSIESELNAVGEYNYLIEHENFRPKVLITTSLTLPTR